MVLMLEPLYTCNLACLGCALERHTGKLEDRMSLEECLRAVEESGAPIVSICGGEPTIYPELKELLEGIIERKRHIYLCTNALLLDKNLFGKVAPHKRLTINVHLDGMQKTHDLVCDRAGVFDKAIEMIKESKRLGYHVTTNTTVFKETQMSEIEDVCKLVSELGVDGMMISPGYHYESVDRDIFLSQREIQTKFKRVLELSKRYRLMSTPMYLEFTAGMPDTMKLRGGTTKFVLRESMKGVLPERILSRSKMGFPVPIGRWFRGPFKSVIDEYVLSDRALARDTFEPDFVKRLVSLHQSGEDHSERLWALLNFEIWLRQFVDGDQSSAPKDHDQQLALTA